MKRKELAVVLADILEELDSRGKNIKLDGHILEICDKDMHSNNTSSTIKEIYEEENNDNIYNESYNEEESMKLLEKLPKGVKQDLLRSAKTCNSNAIGISISGESPVIVSVNTIEKSLLKESSPDDADINNEYELDEEGNEKRTREIEARSKSNFFYAVNSRLNDVRFKNSYDGEYVFKSSVKKGYLIPQKGASAIVYNKLAERFNTKCGLIHIKNGITLHYLKDDNFVVYLNNVTFEDGFICVNLDKCNNKCMLTAEEVEAVLVKMCTKNR